MNKIYRWLNHPEQVSPRYLRGYNLIVLLILAGLMISAFASLF